MPNLFSKLFNIKKGNSFLGIDIGASSIKIVQLKKKREVVILETYGELSLGPYANIEAGRSTNLSAGDIGGALVNLLEESNVTTKECGVSIPLNSSLIFTMEMPEMDNKQLAQMIPIEARKYIPVPIIDVDLDWRVVPKDDKSSNVFMGANDEDEVSDQENKEKAKKIEVLVVAIHKDAVSKHKEIIKNSNLNLQFLEIEIFSTIRAVAGQNSFDFAVLDMGSGATKLYIVERGMVRDSHIVGRGSQDITLNISRSMNISVDEAEQKKISVGVVGKDGPDKQVSEIVSSNLERVFAEINRVILTYQKKYNKNVDKLIITGGGAIIKGMSEFVGSNLDIDVEIANPFAKVETPAFLEDLLKQAGPGFAVALGIALRGLNQSD
ncbi:pilus assembly protein PilM [Patescibacteria group bacterium]|nr:pilus assembly protein PilM [Patescibacteria group bacterium]MCG2694610.1 pilus assembly protein PilM [Candidatus Parcubacteria bacterium]